MKITNPLKRAAKSLLGVGVCLALSAGAASAAQHAPKLNQLLAAPAGPAQGGGGGGVNGLTFTKVGTQLNCELVEYRLSFRIKLPAGNWDNPAVVAQAANLPMRFVDQLPDGLKAISATVTGDITDAVGGAIAPTIETTVNLDDTVKITDFRLSALDLDGDGSNTTRGFDIVIQARIDPAVFPAAVLVANQAQMMVQQEDLVHLFPSHDPALPDDGNPYTGDQTKILIDVENCLPPPPPPPPPGDQPCFVIDEGEVDCDPLGGGAFIFKMPMGAEMGGRTIELVSLTPGIVIAPPSQVVPIGGGILAWTILGANPGDKIELLVTGVNYVGDGGDDGVAICCTQRIDIEIPDDLVCPVKEPEPDLEIKKRADVATCDELGPCDFTIQVKNVGDAPYTGKIVVDEVTTPGNAPVVAGPNAPWVCAPLASPMTCEHPEITLEPGEFVTLKLGFAPGPGWGWDFIRNCASVDPFDGEHHQDNNGPACATIDICLPGDPNCTPQVDDERPDIGVRKSLYKPCTGNGFCVWQITIFNAGSTNINSPVTFVDEFPFGDVNTATFQPSPPWNCVALAGNKFRCEHPGLNLPVGASTNILVSSIDNPADYPDRKIRNCAQVSPLPGEVARDNNTSCANGEFPRDPNSRAKVEIRKVCQAVTVAGAGIPCRVSVSNVGNGAPAGSVIVTDAAVALTGGAAVVIQSVTPDGADWVCTGLPAQSLTCKLPPAGLPPGMTRSFDVVLNSTRAGFNNCAVAKFAAGPGAVPGQVRACADGGSSNISVEKTGDAVCRLGEACSFEFTFTNTGKIGFSGIVRIGDALGINGAGPVNGASISISPPLGCSPEPTTLPINCVTTMTLDAGESRVHTVTVDLPAGGALANAVGNTGASAKNCVAIIGAKVGVNGKSAFANAFGGRSRDADYYSCFPFRIDPEKVVPQCSAGMVVKKGGRCGCPDGTSFVRGQCQVTPPVVRPLPPVHNPRPPAVRPLPPVHNPRPPVVRPRPPARSCRIKGQSVNRRGQCSCPSGQKVIRGACRIPPTVGQPPVRPVPPSCRIKGQSVNRGGQCACPKGQKVLRGACRIPPTVGKPPVRPNPTVGKPPVRPKPTVGKPPKRPKPTLGKPPVRSAPGGGLVVVPRQPTLKACRANQIRVNGRCVTPTIKRPTIKKPLRVRPLRKVQPQIQPNVLVRPQLRVQPRIQVLPQNNLLLPKP